MKLQHQTQYSAETIKAHYKRCNFSFETLAQIVELASEAAPNMRASVETHKERFSDLLDKPENAHLKYAFNEHIKDCDTCRNTLITLTAEHQREVEFIRFARAS